MAELTPKRRAAIRLQRNDNAATLLQIPNRTVFCLLAGRFRMFRRGLAVLVWTIPSMLIQAVFLMIPGNAKVTFARIYWAVFARLIGVKVRVIGVPLRRSGIRPVVYVSNHSSWVDIPVVGGVLDGCFVAKGDVAAWPIIGTIARLGRTVFVSRNRASTGKERDIMRSVINRNDNLILFPEGTSSDGSRVLTFRTSFFSVAEARAGDDLGSLPIIQPVSVVYDRLDYLPAGRASRPTFAWYGDMDIASHFQQLARHVGLRATVLIHAPLDPAAFGDRKALSQAVWRIVAEGASTLRQNRIATPLAVPDVTPPGGRV